MSFVFGDRVIVHKEAVRLKKGWQGVHTTHRDAIRYGEWAGPAWPGEPLESTKVDTDESGAVVIRRVPLNRLGVVVGKTWREEGIRTRGGYEDPGYLARKGDRVEVWEVAIPTDGKARLVLAVADDLEALTTIVDAKGDE